MGKYRFSTLAAFAALSAASVALAGCGANSAAALDAMKVVVTDTNCSHDDKISVVTGAAGIAASVTASAERHCPVGGASSLKVGQTVGGSTDTSATTTH